MDTQDRQDDDRWHRTALVATVVAVVGTCLAGLSAVLGPSYDPAWWQLVVLIILLSAVVLGLIALTFVIARRREFHPRGLTWLLLLGMLVLVVWLTWYSLRHVLEAYQAHASLSPDDAPAILGALSGSVAMATAVSVIVVRLMRGFGAMRKDSGSGTESASKGRAEIIRAEAEAEAMLITANAEAEATRIRARVELRRAETDTIRADLYRMSYESLNGSQPVQGQGPSATGDSGPAVGLPGTDQSETV
jgi:hypothetical protein